MNTTGIQWRNTARPVRFFFLDARSMVCFGIWVLHMCMETFYLSLVSIVIFSIIDRFGITPIAALRIVSLAPFSTHRERLSLYTIRRRFRC